jgi:phage terminase large subunit-like protein
MVARKNGKSTLAAAIGIYLMIADQEHGAEIYAVATKKDQAKIIWLEAKRMVKKSPALLRKIKPLVAEMYASDTESYFKPLGADSETLDGLNVHGGLFDEVHAWKDKNLYDVVVDGTSAREQPLIFITTTAGTVREGIFDLKYEEIERIINGYGDGIEINDRILPIIYELDSRDEWTKPDRWVKANPGLGTIKRLEKMQGKVKAAQLNPLLVKNLLCKDFNIRETGIDSYFSYEDILNKEQFDPAKLQPAARYGIGGADLSETTDLTSACVIFKNKVDGPLYYLGMFWIPEDVFERRVHEDKVPYDVWRDLGLVRVIPGNKNHPKYVTEWYREISKKYDIFISWVGYDAWAAQYWVDEMAGEFGNKAMIGVRQGKQTLSNPLKELKADLCAKRIIYNNNPVLKWCMTNVNIETDKNNNIQPHKGKNQRARIDGFAALLDAYVIYKAHLTEYDLDIGG